MNSQDSEHRGKQQPPPRTLLSQPSVSFYFDGLIFMTYNKRKRLFQAGVHTQAENHQLTIKVATGTTPKWPKDVSDWNPSLAVVKAISPLWLYVDSGQGLREDEFSAKLHEPEDINNEQSFRHVLDFEGRLYKRQLELRPEPLAALNIAQGIFYSAANTMAELKAFAQGQPSSSATTVDNIKVSTLSAADIDSRSDANVKRSIVLAKNDGAEEVFRFPLEEGKHYTITVMNAPVKHQSQPKPEDHFLQFYELFPLRQKEKVFLVEPATADTHFFSHPDSPPCIQTKGSLSNGLP